MSDVVPRGKLVVACVVRLERGAQMSDPVAVPGFTVADRFPVHSVLMAAGHEMVGLVVSTTVTETVQSPVVRLRQRLVSNVALD